MAMRAAWVILAVIVTAVSGSSPAIWGAPVPDYSNIQIDHSNIYLYTLLFVDQKTVDHYRGDLAQMRREVVKLVRESNKYFYQLGIRIAVSDVLPTNRNDLSLYSMEDFRSARLPNLPYHDFAVLISYRYAGGLAFVSGMCSSKAVMMAGFYPHNPSAMGSIFFHEVAHLFGVSHTNANETLDVPNCNCGEMRSRRSVAAPTYVPTHTAANGCLRIPGFDHNCTAQLMANLLYRSRCLSKRPRGVSLDRTEGIVASSQSDPTELAICGNGIVEVGEECDCGIPSFCSAWNCDPEICERPIPLWKIRIVGGFFGLLVISALYGFGRNRLPSWLRPSYSAVPTSVNTSKLNILFRSAKSLFLRQKTSEPEKTNVVIIRSVRELHSQKVSRPRLPPPPIPSIGRPKVPPPPLPHPIDYKFADFDDDF